MGLDYVNPEDMTDDELSELVLEQVATSMLSRWDDIKTNSRMKNLYMAKDEPRRAERINSGRTEEDLAQISNTFLPVATGIVDTAKTLLYANMFASPDYIRCVVQDPEDEERSLAVCRHLKIRHQQMGFLSDFVDDFLLEFLLYDFAVAKTDWIMRGMNEAVPVEEPIEVDFGQGYTYRSTRRRTKMRYNPFAIRRSNTELIPNWKCFPDPGATRPGDWGGFFCIADSVLQQSLLMEQKTKDNPLGIYEFDKDEIDTGRSQIFDRITNPADRRLMQQRFDTPSRLKRVNLIHSLMGNFVVTITTGGTVIRKEKTNGFSLARASFRPMNDRFGGMGILHALERAALDVNFMVNSRRDFNNYVLNPITIMDKETFDAAEFGDGSFRPGQLFLSEGEGPASDRIHTEQPGNPVVGDHQAEMAMQLSIMSDVSNIGKNQQGNVQTGRRSAKEIGVAAQATGTAMGITAKKLELGVFEPIYDQQLTLERVNFDGSETARSVGDPDLYVFVTPELLAFATTPRMMALGMENIRQDAVEKAQFLQAVQVALSNPTIMKFTNAEALVRKFWKSAMPNSYFDFIGGEKPSDTTNIPPDVENFMFNSGRIPQVRPINDDERHLLSHGALRNSATYASWPGHIQSAFDSHINDHKAQMAAKRQAQAQQRGGPANRGQSVTSDTQLATGSPVAETQVA